MDAVEITDADDRGAEVAGDVVELVESLHATVFSSSKPCGQFLRLCHPERSEGSAVRRNMQIPRFARDDNF
jgi:hypothetical protein